MDINSIQPSDYSFDLLHPATDEPLGVAITLRSMHSDEVRKVQRALADKAIKLERKRKSLTAADIEENNKLLFKAAVSGWKWTNDKMELNGDKKPAFNEKNVNALLDIKWIADQINEQLGDEKNFFKV